MKHLLFLTVFLHFLLFRLSAQVDTDSLFSIAVRRASEKNYEDALLLSRQVMSIAPERSDVLIFMANVYAWHENFDSSKYYINRSRELNPANPGLYDTWLNILQWDSEYQELLSVIDSARAHGYDNEYNILIKKLHAFKNLKMYSNAIDLFENCNCRNFLDSSQVKSLYRDIQLLHKDEFISMSYSFDYANERNLFQQLASIDYGHRSESNSILVRVNYANRYKSNDLQIESDFYHNGKKDNYYYLNYGYSFRNTVFPQHRAGAEYYFHLKGSFEGSLGGRYLYFPELPAGILTFSVSKYYKSLMFSLRPYYAFTKSGNSVAVSTGIRKYDKEPLANWNFEAIYGNSPDERFITEPSGNYLKLNSYRFRVARNFMIHSTDEIKLVLGYAYDETYLNEYFSRYTLELSYRFRFR